MEEPKNIHLQLPSGAMANVSADATPELLNALDAAARCAIAGLGAVRSTAVLDGVRFRLQSALNRAESQKGKRAEGVIVQDLWSNVKRVIEYIDSNTPSNVLMSDGQSERESK